MTELSHEGPNNPNPEPNPNRNPNCNRNRDRVMTCREWDNAYEPQRTFDKLDVNGDGIVSR